MTVTGQTISIDEQFYAASTDNGLVAVGQLAGISAANNKATYCELDTFLPFNGLPVYCLTSTSRFLIAGGKGELKAFLWQSLMKRKFEACWSIKIGQTTQINWMDLDVQDGNSENLVIGCGDNLIYIYDLESRQLTRQLTGHTDYVHSVNVCDRSAGVAVVSGSEDGAVKLWDTRRPQPEIYSFLPYTESELTRPNVGKFISTVGTSRDWLVCGGGPIASLWNLSTRIMSSRLPPFEGAVFAGQIEDDQIYVGGQNRSFHMSNFGGESCAEISVSATCIYSIVTSPSHNLIFVAGSSSQIDVLNLTDHSKLLTMKITSTN